MARPDTSTPYAPGGLALGTGLLALAALAGCGGGDADPAAGPTSGLDGPDRPLEMAPEPVYAVGGLEAPEWANFGAIGGLAFDAAGNLYVNDTQADQITVIGPDGERLRTVGSAGRGPGELSSPTGFAVMDDGGVAVFDFQHRGWVVYGSDGAFLHTVTVDVEKTGMPGRDVHVHADGSIVAPITGRIRFGPAVEAEEDTVPPHRPIARFATAPGSEAEIVYRAFDMPPPETSGQEQRLGGMVLRMAPERAFVPPLNIAMLPDGLIAVADSFGYRVKLVDASGAVRSVLERPIAPTRVTPAIQEAEKQRRLDELDAGGAPRFVVSGPGGAVRGPDADEMRAFQEARIETLLFADAIPVIEDIAVDHEGRIWVQRSSGVPGEPGPTDLITSDGRYLGTLAPEGLRIPAAFGPGGLIARVERDEFDVPTIVVERLPPS